MADVDISIGGKDDDATKVLDRLQRQIAGLKEKVANLNSETKKGGQEAAGGMEKFASSIVKAISGVSAMALGQQALAMATQITNEKLEAQINLQNKQKTAVISAADAEAKAMRNLGQASTAERNDLRNRVESISKESGFAKKDVWMQFNDVLSAKGSMSNSVIDNAIRQTNRLVPEAGGDMERRLVAGAAVDLARITGSEDVRSNLGFLMGVGKSARVTSTQALAENAVPAIGGIKAYGGSEVEAAALFSAFTSATVDTTGAVSGTAGISFAEQLRKFDPKSKSTAERIAKIQANPALQKRFLKGKDPLSLEKKVQPYAEQLLTNPASGIAKEYAANLAEKAIASPAARVETFEQIVGGVSESMGSQAAGMARSLEAASENRYASDDFGARTAAVREFMDKSFDQSKFAQKNSWTAMIQGRQGFEQEFEHLLHQGMDPFKAADIQMNQAATNMAANGDTVNSETMKAQLEALREIAKGINQVNSKKPAVVPKGGEQ